MGKLYCGPYKGFLGRTGNLIGTTWKGKDVIRTQAPNVAQPNSTPQLEQRSKFAVAMAVLKPLRHYLRIGFREMTVGMTAFNAAFGYAVSHAVGGEYPEYAIDYSQLLVAQGSLNGADAATVAVADGAVKFTWSDDLGVGDAKTTDIALPLVYNVLKRLAVFGRSPASRIEGETTTAVPASWVGDAVVCYLAFQSMDGTMVSNSQYLGEMVIV